MTIVNGFAPPPKIDGQSSVPKLLPLQESMFQRIRYEKYFIDRTKFLEHFLNPKKFEHYRISSCTTKELRPVYVTAPSTFGKSTIVDMMFDFFALETYRNGTIITKNMADHSKYELFKGTYIFDNNPDFFRKHFGKYPVLKLDLASVNVTDLQSFLISFASILNAGVRPYEENLRPFAKKVPHLKSIIDLVGFEEIRSNASIYRWIIPEILDLMRERFQEGCLILVDNFDAAADKMLASKMPQSEIKLVRKHFSFTFQFLERTFYHGCFLTGRLSLGLACKDVICLIRHFPISDTEELASFFGLTQKNVNDLLKKYKPSNLDESTLRKHFYGYRIRGSSMRVYPTASVIESIKNNKITYVWSKNIGKTRFHMTFMLAYFQVWYFSNAMNVDEHVSLWAYDDWDNFREGLLNLKSILDDAYSNHFDNVRTLDPVWKYAHDLGYLTIGIKRFLYRKLLVPNNEVKKLISSQIINSIRTHFQIEKLLELFADSVKHLNKNTFQNFIDSVQGIFSDSDMYKVIRVQKDYCSCLYMLFVEYMSLDAVQENTDTYPLCQVRSGNILVPMPDEDTGLVIECQFNEKSIKFVPPPPGKKYVIALEKFKNQIYIVINFDTLAKIRVFSAAMFEKEKDGHWSNRISVTARK